ncbi:MAG: purine-nucleoside phosphorylase [Muribaculaceae bacterium]|nr:purine-nucleoside phosphorylase [Muribaculaceae bacterium]
MTQEINWLDKIQESAAWLRNRVGGEMPKTAIILGTGLGELVTHIDIKESIPYKEIPNFPISTVEGHSGRLIFGNLGSKYIMAMQGRFHYYEGYSMKEATFPVRVMKALGVKTLFVSNAAGGMNPDFKVGDLMIITDHINLFPDHPLRGKNYAELGPRFPAMNEAYSRRLIDKAREIARNEGIRLVEGVYVGTQGPTFETPSEYRFFYRIGGDAVGMSTVPEVIVARHAGMEVFGMSVITDLGGEGIFLDVSHEEVQKAAAKAEPIMSHVMEEIINQFQEL